MEPRAGLRYGGGEFTSYLRQHPGGWVFAPVPEQYAPPVTHAWGRTPVRATVDGVSWDTSVWRDTKSGETLLAVPKRVRGTKGHGDPVQVTIAFSTL